MFHYYLKTIDDKEEIKLDVMEMNGSIIKSFSNKAKEKADQLLAKNGGNGFVWNMRHPGYKTFPGLVFYGSPNNGPKAVPGKYKVRLTVGSSSMEQEFEILKDPRVNSTLEDLKMQFDFLVKVRDKVSEANQGVIDIRKIKDDLNSLRTKLSNEVQYKELNDAVNQFEKELSMHENNIHQTKNRSVQDPLNYGIKLNNRLAHLMVEQAQGDFRPTQQGEEVRQMLTKEVDAELERLNKTINTYMNRINQMAKEKGIEVISIKKEVSQIP